MGYEVSFSSAMYFRTYLVFLYIQQYNSYVFDLSYPVVLKSSQDMLQFHNDAYKTDHFGFSLDLAKDSNSISLWVGAPKGASLQNTISGSVHICNLNIPNPTCAVKRPMNLGESNNDKYDDQMLGITVKTITSSRQGTEVICLYVCTIRIT